MPAALEAGEITDKGYVNQRAVRERRADLVAVLVNGLGERRVISRQRIASI